MAFLKKTMMALGAFFLILWGGAGTQSNSTLLQGGGFLGLLIGLVVLYIFVKMAWRAMGCLPAFLIIAGITSFIVYAIGGFNNGVTGIIPTLKAFLGQQSSQTQTTDGKFNLIDEDDIDMSGDEDAPLEAEEAAADVPVLRKTKPQQPQQQPQQQNQNTGTFQKIMGSFGGQKTQQQQPMNPQNFPAITGSVRVVNGDTLMMNGYYIRLYGIDAPESDQTCANRTGRSYHCGRVAATWLRDWLMDNQIECRIMQQDKSGNMVGTCSLGQYDIGAAMVNAGWAVAYTKYTDVYLPYQEQAMQRRDGLWQGKFYQPADWRAIKAKKPKIRVKKSQKRKSMWNF